MPQQIDSIIAKIELSAEIAQIALSCDSCQKRVKEVIENYYHRVGGLTASNSQTKEKIQNDILRS